jgi:hypothetical protein
MKKIFMLQLLLAISFTLSAEVIEKTYYFFNPQISEANGYQTIRFKDAMLTGIVGEPMLPYRAVSLLLPPGHVAGNIEIIPGEEVFLDGFYQICPMQNVQPVSKGGSGIFVKNNAVYLKDMAYPVKLEGNLSTGYLNGFSVATSVFTPIRYNPAKGKLSYYKSVIIRINTFPDEKSETALQNLNSSAKVIGRLGGLVQNMEAFADYPTQTVRTDDYQMIIVTPAQFEDDFQPLIGLYKTRGIVAKVAATETIYATMSGLDNPEKIRNYIIQEYQNHGIEYVTLGGDVEHVPYRGFYCWVQSGSYYEDSNIPSDLYYSALDGNWNNDGDSKWAEIGEDDLLPEIGVARLSFSTQAHLDAMLNKTMNYQANPVPGEFNKPLLAGEWLYDAPETWGSDYLELLVGHRTDNGYETTGIPESDDIERLYDENGTWTKETLLQKINTGKSFIHHVGHANHSYAMRLSNSHITNANFSQVNGTTYNFTFVYSHGCICGAFDYSDCIAEKMVNINNFAVAVVMNSRYGWFNEGQTEGPSAHLHREFCDALYNQKESHIGMAHTISKIETSPWVNAPGQWEQGALRWCFYDCNVLGDAALNIWTDEPAVISADLPDTITMNATAVSVSILQNNTPVEGLSCVFIKNGIIYGNAKTDAAGVAEIVFTTSLADTGQATMYVSGYNCLLHEYPVFVDPVAPLTQQIVINGGWTGISSSLNPADNNLDEICSDIQNKLLMLNDLTSFYQPGNPENTLTVWDFKSGYFIKTSEPVQLNFQGFLPADKTINLVEGWNLLPVLSLTEVSITGLFSDQIGKVEVIKDAVGLNVFWPQMQVESLQWLLPGRTYLLKANQDFEIGF